MLLLLVLPLYACASGGFSLEKAEVDQTILTGNVPDAQAAVDAERVSDQATIRNAVSAADVEGLRGAALAWANPDTGSRGAISSLFEHNENGALCRRFTTSRESFDGVSLYKGEVCQAGPGAWRMMAFQAL